jgi:outer membrane protein assembly factor BamA
MRGFRTNARNGAHAAVVNAEVRIPVLSTWVKRPLTSDFARHLQAVGFFDAGSAWNGLHPYADDNAFNRVTVTRYPITVTIDNNREPILAGTGFGVRSKVLGYWMRADWSWGIDDGRWQDRVFSLSFHLDF